MTAKTELLANRHLLYKIAFYISHKYTLSCLLTYLFVCYHFFPSKFPFTSLFLSSLHYHTRMYNQFFSNKERHLSDSFLFNSSFKIVYKFYVEKKKQLTNF